MMLKMFRKYKKKKVIFSETAILKTTALIEYFNMEVGWHGVMNRLDKNRFIINDIIVYPQAVDSASILADQFEYDKWLMGLEDNVFKDLRMHGHSHARFGVTPSSTDNKLRAGIVETMRRDQFYIFIIMNKRYDCHIKLFDMVTKRIYENGDIRLYATLNGRQRLFGHEIMVDVKKLLTTVNLDKFIQHADSIVTQSGGKEVSDDCFAI